MDHAQIVTIYTDGSCSGNPGPGGWAAILTGRKTIKAVSGGIPGTTSNRMELTAVLEGLKTLSKPSGRCRLRQRVRRQKRFRTP